MAALNYLAAFLIFASIYRSSRSSVQACEIGEEEWRTACSHLSAYGSWGKINREVRHNSCNYGAPHDWIIVENKVNIKERRGEVDVSVDVLNEDVRSNIVQQANKAFDRAVQLALGNEFMDVAAKIRAKWSQVKGTYTQIEHQGSPILRGRVRAKGDGHFFNRKSSQITISIDALLKCIGPMTEEGIYEELKQEFKLQENPVQTSSASIYTTLTLFLLLILLLIGLAIFCYWRRLVCFKNRSKPVESDNRPITVSVLPPVETILPKSHKKILPEKEKLPANYRQAPLPPIMKPSMQKSGPVKLPPIIGVKPLAGSNGSSTEDKPLSGSSTKDKGGKLLSERPAPPPKPHKGGAMAFLSDDTWPKLNVPMDAPPSYDEISME